MTDIDTLIAEVRRLDRERTPGRYEGRSSGIDNWPARGPEPDVLVEWLSNGFPSWTAPQRETDSRALACFGNAAPILAAEVARLRAGGCARDQHTTQFCAEAVAKDAEIVRLHGALEEQRLTLAAEQGRQEGAPAGWERYRDGVWIRHLADGCHLRVERLDGIVWRWWANARNGAWDKRSGDAATARAAMQAADAAQEPR